MAASLWRRLARPLALHGTGQPTVASFEADWSAISPAGLGMVFKELLAHLLGAPPPAELHKDFYALGGQHRTWSKNLDLEDIYFHRHFVEGVETGFLVRGVIFDMPALIQTSREDLFCPTAVDMLWLHKIRLLEIPFVVRTFSCLPANSVVCDGYSTEHCGFFAEHVKAVPKRWDEWTTMVDSTTTEKLKDPTESVSASDVLQKLGLKGLSSFEAKLPSASEVEPPASKTKLQEKQKLEEVLGSGDSIRAKYMLKIQAKKVAADARREQGNLEIASPSGSRLTAGDRDWQAMAGASGLVRYLEVRVFFVSLTYFNVWQVLLHHLS